MQHIYRHPHSSLWYVYYHHIYMYFYIYMYMLNPVVEVTAYSDSQNQIHVPVTYITMVHVCTL